MATQHALLVVAMSTSSPHVARSEKTLQNEMPYEQTRQRHSHALHPSMPRCSHMTSRGMCGPQAGRVCPCQCKQFLLQSISKVARLHLVFLPPPRSKFRKLQEPVAHEHHAPSAEGIYKALGLLPGATYVQLQLQALKPHPPAWCLCPYVGDVAAASEPHALLQDAVSVVNFTRLALSCLCQPLGLRVAL